MPNMPVPTQNDVVIQSQTTGAVDSLEFIGNQLVASQEIDYGLGSDFKIVAAGNFGTSAALVAQSQTTGVADLLFLNPYGQLTGSELGTTPLPRIVGAAWDIPSSQGIGTTLVGQSADGSLDLLGVDYNGNLATSQTIAGTAGIPRAVGVGEGADGHSNMFQGVGNNDTVVTQLADGRVDLIGLSGNASGSITLGGTDLLSSTLGLAPIVDVNPYNNTNENVRDPNTGNEGSQFITLFGRSDRRHLPQRRVRQCELTGRRALRLAIPDQCLGRL
jgi:hypothetical protein